jgi:head-tail adaptor
MPVVNAQAQRGPLASGKRIHTVVVQRPNPGTPPSQPDGDVSEAWADLMPVWHVAIEPATEDPERQTAGTSIGSASHVVTGPYRADVTLTTRLLVEGTRAFNIVSRIDREERHRELILRCREVVA